MNILLAIPFEIGGLRGNSTAARRLVAGFQRNGHIVSVLGPPDVLEENSVLSQIESFRPEVVLVLHAWRCAAVAPAMKRITGIPVVTSMRGTDLNEMLDDSATRLVISEVLATSAAIVVFHHRGKERLGSYDRLWAEKARIIPNGVDLPESNVDYRHRLGIPRSAFVFVAVSGLREVKRPLWPIAGIDKLRSKHSNLVWLHAGPSVEKDITEELRDLMAKHAWLHHVDKVPHEEMASFLRAGDVFLSASRSEGMPHAVREAMLAGLPVLLSDIEGHRNMARAEHEALFFADGAGFLSQASRLIRDPGLGDRLGESARRRVLSELEESDEIGRYLSLFRELVEKRMA